MKRFLNNHFFIGLIIAIVGVTVITRVSRIAELGYFMLDEERDAFLVRRMLVDHRPLLVGGVIPGGINVGPFFFYLSAIPYFISSLNPVGPAYMAGVIGTIGVMGIYLAGKKLLDKKVGLLATIFSAFSILNIVYQRPWWPLTLSQLVTLGVYLSLWNLTRSDLSRKGQTLRNWLLILVAALIIGAQSDPSTLSLIPLSVIWLWQKRNIIKLKLKEILLGLGLFFSAHITWLIFEFRHNFLSTKAIIRLFQGLSFDFAQDSPLGAGPVEVLRMTAAMLYRLFFITGPLDVTKQISPAQVFLSDRLNGIWWPGAWLLLIVLAIYVYKGLSFDFAQDSPYNVGRQLLSLHFLIALLGILIYTTLFPGYVHEWLWQFMFPAFFLIFADVLVRLGGKKILAIWGILGIWGIWQISLFTKLENAAGLGNKLKIVREAQIDIADRSYELRSDGELRYGGWRYLFTLYGNPPVKSYMDYVYTNWLYPKTITKPEVLIKINNPVDDFPDFTLEKSVDEGSYN